MRILLFSGKGGVGKTSLAAATGVKLAELNYRTLVMSIDPAHSLADSFDLERDLFHAHTSDPLAITEKLSILELNIQKEIKRHWQEISSYVSSVLRTTGISGVEAEELAILPGMEELSAMMYINQYRREQTLRRDRAGRRSHRRVHALHQHADDARLVHEAHFPVSAESAEGRAAHRQSRRAIRAADRQLLRATSAIFSRSSKASTKSWRIRNITSVRLVTNPEKMVLRETQRAFVYFSLHGLTVDTVIVNRVLPADVRDAWFSEWHASQEKVLHEIEEYFAPVPVKRVPLFAHEVLGKQRLQELAQLLYPGTEDPGGRDADRKALHLREGKRRLRDSRAFAVCHEGRSGTFQEGRRTGGGDRHASPPHRPAAIHGDAAAVASETRTSSPHG